MDDHTKRQAIREFAGELKKFAKEYFDLADDLTAVSPELLSLLYMIGWEHSRLRHELMAKKS